MKICNPIACFQIVRQSDYFSAPKLRDRLGDLVISIVGSLLNGENTHTIYQTNSTNKHPYQTTSIKLSRKISFIWTGNRGSPRKLISSLKDYVHEQKHKEKSVMRAFYTFLEDFERKASQRPNLILDIDTATLLIEQTAGIYEALRVFEDNMITLRDYLLKAQAESTQEQELVKKMLMEVRKITLPKRITQESVKAYAKKVNVFCNKQITLNQASLQHETGYAGSQATKLAG